MLEILRIKDRCTGCGSCVEKCPAKALTMEYDNEDFYFPRLKEDLCNDCRICETKCPVLSKEPSSVTKQIRKFYTPKIARSGRMPSFDAIFSALSEKIISEGGIVYGTRYDCKNERTEYASSEEYEPSVLGKSAFTEPYTGKIFSDICVNAEKGKKIIFCGVPCHVQGLKTYLGKDSENIVFVERSCHGVISNRHFTAYKKQLEKNHHSPIIDVDFRPKDKGLAMLIEFANSKDTVSLNNKCLYHKPFNAYSCLRRSCYKCAFQEKTSDIVIGDTEKIIKNKYGFRKTNGYSFILTNTEKGEALINSLKHPFVRHVTPPEKKSSIYDDRTASYSKYLPVREQIFTYIKKYGYPKALEKMRRKTILKSLFPDKLNSWPDINLRNLLMKKDRYL